MAPVTPITTSTGAAADVDLAAEVERLRTLLERHPSCLMRVGIRGTLLAANETALSFLGGSDLGHVLDTSLLERIEGDDVAAVWSGFLERVANAGSASLECEMTDLAGVHRAVILQAVTLPPHPDGDESLLITARDVSTSRRLQASLQEQEALRRSAQETLHDVQATIQQLESRLTAVTAERERLRAAADAAAHDREQLAAALEQLKGALSTAVDATLLAQQVIDKGGQA